MHTFAWTHSGSKHRICHGTDLIRSSAGGIYILFRRNIKLFVEKFIANQGCDEFADFVFFKAGHPSIVERGSARAGKCFDESKVIASIVKLSVGVTDCAAQAVRPQSRHSLQRFLPRQKTAWEQVAFAGHRIVKLHSREI